MTRANNLDYVLVRGQWFLHRNNRDATNVLKNAKLFKTWEAANERATGTSWKFCRVEELGVTNEKHYKIVNGARYES